MEGRRGGEEGPREDEVEDEHLDDVEEKGKNMGGGRGGVSFMGGKMHIYLEFALLVTSDSQEHR